MRSGKPTPWAVADTSKLDGRGLVEPTGADCGGDEAARSRQQSLEIGLSYPFADRHVVLRILILTASQDGRPGAAF